MMVPKIKHKRFDLQWMHHAMNLRQNRVFYSPIMEVINWLELHHAKYSCPVIESIASSSEELHHQNTHEQGANIIWRFTL